MSSESRESIADIRPFIGRLWYATGLLFMWLLLAGHGCRFPDNESQPLSATELQELAGQFRAYLKAGDHAAARNMMTSDPRRWWGAREGPGTPWVVGENSTGPWAGWDEHFQSRNEVVEWRSDSLTATVVMRETNDYFQLLERGWVMNAITYHFDETGLIEGWSIEPEGDRPPGMTEEFLVWARENDPEEIEELMPGGEIDPSGDHPERFRQLLNRWRIDAGRDPLE